MKNTEKNLNELLKKSGFNGVVSKADGTWYLAGYDFSNTYDACLYCTRLSQLNHEFLLSEAKRMKQNDCF